MEIENEDDILDISDLLKKCTPTQKWAVFEKEVTAFFIKNVPGFPELCQLRLLFYANDMMQPSGFNDWPLGTAAGNNTYKSPYMYMMDKIKKDKNIILRVMITGTSKVPSEVLEKMFDKFRTNDGAAFWSKVFSRSFEVGDFDDVSAVSIRKDEDKGWISSNQYIYIWIRSWA